MNHQQRQSRPGKSGSDNTRNTDSANVAGSQDSGPVFASNKEADEHFLEVEAERLRSIALQAAREWGAAATETISTTEAATRLGYVKRNGKIRESFYRHQAPRFGEKRGGRWTLSRRRFEAHLQETP